MSSRSDCFPFVAVFFIFGHAFDGLRLSYVLVSVFEYDVTAGLDAGELPF